MAAGVPLFPRTASDTPQSGGSRKFVVDLPANQPEPGWKRRLT